MRFFQLINEAVPDGLNLRLASDNCAINKTRRSGSGCCAIRCSACASRQPEPGGSTRSRCFAKLTNRKRAARPHRIEPPVTFCHETDALSREELSKIFNSSRKGY
jgi:hypothetical protein